MKKLLMLALALCLLCSAALADVAVDEATFPDEIFREEIVKKLDKDKDGTLTDKEIAAVKEIECRDKGIKTLQGIENFTALTKLFANGNQLTELDITVFPDLEVLHVPGNQITALDFSKTPKLTDLQLAENQLAEIDLSILPALTSFQCSGIHLGKLDVTGNPELTYLEAIDCGLSELDVSQNPGLTDLYLLGNQLKQLDISGCPKLVALVGKVEKSAMDDPRFGKADAWNGDSIGCWMWVDPGVEIITEAK